MASTSKSPVNRKKTPEVKERMYKAKVIEFLGRKTPIILQNENGPCSLIAVCNFLLLKNRMDLNPCVKRVSEEKLLSLVTDNLRDSCIDNKDGGPIEDQQENTSKAIESLHEFAKGVFVDVKFNRINDFEVTKELVVFDVLKIPLYHGWLIDPQDSETASAIGSKSHSTLQDELVALDARKMENLKLKETVETDDVIHDAKLKSSESGKHVSEIEMVTLVKKDVGSSSEAEKGNLDVHEGELIRNFLNNNTSQLTVYGLFSLHRELNESELCVFFRNDHFNTMFKIGNALYLLVTDQGYIHKPGVVWEKLHEVNGDTLFVDSHFEIFKPAICEIEEVIEDLEYLEETENKAAQEMKSLSSNKQVEQQSQHDPPAIFPSGFIVGPEKNYSEWPRPESALSSEKSKPKRVKDKCNLM